MRSLVYLKAIVIVHGKSEKQICDWIKRKLKLKIEIVSEKKGNNSIQITSLMRILNDKRFRNYKSFINNFDDVELTENGKNLSENFKIFVIVDTDDCTEEQKEDYINGKMFQNHWAHKYIVPIYNSPKLEPVLKKAGIPFQEKGDKQKKEYIKIFPTDVKYEKTDVVQVSELTKKLEKVKDTNMDEFFNFCLKTSE